MRKATTNPRCKISTEYMWYYLVHFICLLVLTLLNIVQGRSRRITETRWPPTDPHNWTLKTHNQELSGNVVTTKVQKSMWSVGVTIYTFIYLIYYLCAICCSIHFYFILYPRWPVWWNWVYLLITRHSLCFTPALHGIGNPRIHLSSQNLVKLLLPWGCVHWKLWNSIWYANNIVHWYFHFQVNWWLIIDSYPVYTPRTFLPICYCK